MPIRFHKVVSALPGTLTPDTLYMVRVGAGFDLYCSDSTGSVAHALNSSGGGGDILSGYAVRVPHLYTPCSPCIGNVVSTGSPTTNQVSYMPFSVPREIIIQEIAVVITTAAAGNCQFGIYSNQQAGSGDREDRPHALLHGSGSVSTSSTGLRASSTTLTLTAGTIYWAAAWCSSSSVQFRTVPTDRILTNVGRDPGLGYNAMFRRFQNGLTAGLPSTVDSAVTLWADQFGAPAVFFKEAAPA